jgi:hypothetical protein
MLLSFRNFASNPAKLEAELQAEQLPKGTDYLESTAKAGVA